MFSSKTKTKTKTECATNTVNVLFQYKSSAFLLCNSVNDSVNFYLSNDATSTTIQIVPDNSKYILNATGKSLQITNLSKLSLKLYTRLVVNSRKKKFKNSLICSFEYFKRTKNLFWILSSYLYMKTLNTFYTQKSDSFGNLVL